MASAKAKQLHKTHKWADLQKEADRRAQAGGRPERPPVEPFIIDDVEPPIIIAPPDEKTTLIISEQIGLLSMMMDSKAGIQRVLPLLRAFCGDQFPRVWAMLPDENTTENVNVLMQMLLDHFSAQLAVLQHAREAADLPGGSEASST